jgi:hypothetical protein
MIEKIGLTIDGCLLLTSADGLGPVTAARADGETRWGLSEATARVGR